MIFTPACRKNTRWAGVREGEAIWGGPWIHKQYIGTRWQPEVKPELRSSQRFIHHLAGGSRRFVLQPRGSRSLRSRFWFYILYSFASAPISPLTGFVFNPHCKGSCCFSLWSLDRMSEQHQHVPALWSPARCPAGMFLKESFLNTNKGGCCLLL